MKNIQSVRGMHDCLPKDVLDWQSIEDILKSVLNSYGYNEIRFPIVECTDLFTRSIGDVTDVVEKEMYNFKDRGGNRLTLRPEGTAGCVRAAIEHSLFYYHTDQRLWYMGPMFRRERPQKGRYRQFHQFSAEAFGQIGPDIDAELILINARCWKMLGISKYLKLEINSIGFSSSRIQYRKQLVSFLEKNRSSLDQDSINRIYSNPLRILDTKNEKIKHVLLEAPKLHDYLDEDSRLHFFKLCHFLDVMGVSYAINPYLVRGLDYYNRTVFEWVTNVLGEDKTICAGGRYDNLVHQLGGELIPAIGFSIGLERLLSLIKIVNSSILARRIYIDIYLIILDYFSYEYALTLSECIREKLPCVRLMINYGGGTFKKQYDLARKNNTRFILIIDKQNTCNKTLVLQNLRSKEKKFFKYHDFISKLNEIIL